jgi:hypothetical protein
MKKYILYLIAVACILFTNSKLYAQTTLGTDFWLSFGQNSVNPADKVDLQVRIVAGETAKVTFTFTDLPDANRTVTILENTIYTLSLNNDEKNAVYMISSLKALKKSLHITSDKPVTVYALNNITVSSDATNVLPTDALGKEYFHISYNSASDAMMFVAQEDNTSVEYTIKGRVPVSITLHKGDVWYVQGDSDMIGTHITSDKPIAYFAACKTAMIPNAAHKNADHLFQQIPPVNSWGKQFLVPDLGISAQYPLLVRVMASQDGTSFTHIGGQLLTGSKTTLNKGEFATLSVSSSGCFISSDKPVGVCSFLISYSTPYDKDNAVGGPAEVWIPPIEQSLTSITIASFLGSGSKVNQHYALIVTPDNTCKNTAVTIDGETTTITNSWITQSGYAFTRYNLSKNVPYTFCNQKGLTVLVAGLGPSESYYYLGGSSMHNLALGFSVNGTDSQNILGKTICSEKIALKATIENAHGSPGFLKWYIDDSQANAVTDILEWDTTLTSGIHKITMVVKDISGTEQSLSTTVNIDLPVASITGPTEIIAGKTTTLSPASGGTWKSSNPDVATVSNSGIVTGVSKGEAQFTFTSTSGCSAVTGTVKVIAMYAANDTVSVLHNNSIHFDALANDIFACGKDQISVDIVAGSGLHYGSLAINSDRTFTYKADKGIGIDSVEYSVTCEKNTVRAKIYFVVSKPLSKKYTACENAKCSIGMHPVTGVEYFWYDSSNALMYNTAKNDIVITKSAAPSQSFYAEARYGGKALGRIELTVLLSDNCGLINPVGCAVDGQLLFREDFGGNSVSDVRISPNALPAGVTDYKFRQTDELSTNEYTLVKYIDPNSSRAWQLNFSDHTNPDDKNLGYMFLVDASADARKIYETRITGLCDNISKLYFSAWIANVIPAGNSATNDPELTFELSDDNGNIVETYVTSNIPRDQNGKVKWRNYGFMFNPQGYGSLILKIYNQAQGDGGNDFAMDDIEVRFCVPPVITDISKDTVKLCHGEKFSINASFTDVGDFGNNLVGRWQHGMVNDFHGTWKTVKEITTVNSSVLTSTFNIDSVDSANKGYYRLIVGNSSTINSPNCRVSSHVTYLHIDSLPQTPIIFSLYGNYTLCGNVNTLTLEIKNPGKGVSYQWYKNNSALQSEHNIQLLVDSPGVYKVSSIDTVTGCSSSSEVKIDRDININFPNPVISSVSGGNVICGSQGSVFLTLNNKNDYGSNAVYQWYKDGQIINDATNVNYNATTEGEYYITVKVATCLAVSASIKITDSSGTTVSPVLKSEGDLTELCTGGSLRLYVSNTGSYSATAVYVWYGDDAEVLRGTGMSSYVASSAGKYKVLVYETDGCSALSNEIDLRQGSGTGITKPAIESESGGYEICGNEAGIMLKLTTKYTEANTSYQWFKGDTLLTGANGIYYFAREAGKYSILVSTDKCSSRSDLRTVTKDASGTTVSPVLKSEGDVRTLCRGSNVKLYIENAADYGSDATYIWNKNGIEIYRQKGLDSIFISDTGSYNVFVYKSDGCFFISRDTLRFTMVDSISMDAIVSSVSLPLPYLNTGTMLTVTNVKGGSTPYVYTWYKRTTHSAEWIPVSATTNPVTTGALTTPAWYMVEVSSLPLWSSCNVISDSILIGVEQVNLTLDIISSDLTVCNINTDSLIIKVSNGGAVNATDVVINFHGEGSLSPVPAVYLPKIGMQSDTVFAIPIPPNTGSTVKSGVLKAEIISCNQTDSNPSTVYGSWKSNGWSGSASQADEDTVTLTVHQSSLSLTNSGIVDTVCSGTVFNFTPASIATDVIYAWKRLSAEGISELSGTDSISNVLYNNTADHKPLLVTYNYYNSACSSLEIGKVQVLVTDSIQMGSIISSVTPPLNYNTGTTLSVDVTGGASPYRYTWYRRKQNETAWTAAGSGHPFDTGNLTEPVWFKVDVTSGEDFPVCNSESDSIFINVDQVELTLKFLDKSYSICNTLADSIAIKISNSKPGDATNVLIEFKNEGTLPAIGSISLPVIRGNSDTAIIIGFPENMTSSAQTGNIKSEIVSCDQNDSNPLTAYGSWKNLGWSGNPAQADEDMLNLTVYPNMRLTGKLIDTVCSEETFKYIPESNLGSVTVSWVRQAVAGIKEGYSAGNGEISEILTNEFNYPLTAVYTVTMETEYCPTQVTETVEVTVLPKGKLTLSHSPENGSNIVLGTPITITATLEGTLAKEYIFTYGNDVKKQTLNTYEIFLFNEAIANEVAVSVENEYGCILTGKETFTLGYDLPNIITPKEDKNNKLLTGYDIQVFNRWGSQLYRGKNGWDGKYKGSLVAAGTYLYVVSIPQPDGKLLRVKHSVYVKY